MNSVNSPMLFCVSLHKLELELQSSVELRIELQLWYAFASVLKQLLHCYFLLIE